MNDNTIIELHNLTVKQGKQIVLDAISLSIKKGEFVAILGSNGSGKSTLLQVILGIIKPTAGTISVFGNRVATGNPNIGYSPQAKQYDQDLPITGKEYIKLGLVNKLFSPFAQHTASQVDKVIAELDAEGLAQKKLGKMSGGEQQRISLAQSLVSEPPLLLLDEPLANLDVSYQAEILQRLSQYHKDHNHTILLVSHDINPLLPYIDKVIYLAHTHAQTGKPEDVITEASLTALYGVPVKVFTIEGQIFVAASENSIH